MREILEKYAAERAEILDLIRELVERESKSGAEAALNSLADFVARWLVDFAGGQVDSLPEPGYGTHLRAVFPFGHQLNREPDQPGILVIGHLDTVWPLGTLARKPFTITADGRATGPGIFDMKAGIAILLASLRTLHGLVEPGREATSHPVRVLLTCDEEIGSRTSRALVEAEARRAMAVLVLEPPLPGGIVKTGRKGIAGFTLRATGRAAHAGLDPRHGINAIVELAHQTLAVTELNDDERGVTVNVGMVTGGTGVNVVPAEAVAKVDLRFWEQTDGDRVVEKIRGLRPRLAEASLEVSGGINRPAMPRSAGNLALFARARSLAAELGFELQERAVGGGSDGNFTAALGVPTLDGLGVDGAGAHAENEHILVEDLPRRAALLTRLLQTL